MPRLAQRVPAGGVAPVVACDVLGFRMQRCVHGALTVVEEERLVRVGRLRLADHRDGSIGQVVGQEVALRVLVDVDRVVVVDHAVRLVQVREPVEEAVVPVEALLQRPRRTVAGVVLGAVGAQVPLADHERLVAGATQELRHRRRQVGQLHGVPREPRIGVRHVAHARSMGFETGEQRGTGRRAHRGGVEVGVAHALLREAVEVGRGDLRAVAAEVGEPQVVAQHDDHVRGPFAAGRRLRPRGRRGGEHPSHLAAEARVGVERVRRSCVVGGGGAVGGGAHGVAA